MDNGELLGQVPLFASLSREERDALGDGLRRRRYRRQEVIFHRDDPGESLFVIGSGAVKIALTSEEGREVILTILGPGDYFGDFALLDGEPRSADAIALEATEALALPRARFLAFLRANPDASLALMAALSRQLRRLTETVHDSSFLDVQARLARALVGLVEPSEADGMRTRPITQTDLAALIGATRESVNKWLAFFERRGIISRERGYVGIVDMDELKRRAG